ncbi:hypothetical protein EV177_010099, partial [Coemansia sp. RSA 1804]
ATRRPERRGHGEFDTHAQALEALPEWQPIVWQCSVLEYLELVRSDRTVAGLCNMYKPAHSVEFPASAGQSFTEAVSCLLGAQPTREQELETARGFGHWLACGSDDSEPNMAALMHALGGQAIGKTVSEAIMSTSSSHRRAFLGGFVDGSGRIKSVSTSEPTTDDRRWVISSKQREVAVQIRRLARSLGLRAGDVEEQSSGNSYFLSVSGELMHSVDEF